MKTILSLFFLLSTSALFAQPVTYTTANAHSHNDYEQASPFHAAYDQQFGSVEADVFLLKEGEELWVAHSMTELKEKRRSIDSLYLLPLVNAIRLHGGSVYADKSRRLQVLVDIKTEAVPTLRKLISVLNKYPELTHTATLSFVISGNRPAADSFASYPSFIQFDGVIGTEYSSGALSRIALLSTSWQQLSHWDGVGAIPAKDSVMVIQAIRKAHEQGKPVRFWGAPDDVNMWRALMRWKVDYINTDRIRELSSFVGASGH